MNNLPDSIPKQPVLKAAEDYYRLRREGIGFIEKMASSLWTDYNTHDPGITILESLCYSITDLAYRIGWDINDLLAPATPSTDPNQPFPNQAFFTAREILTVNPVTPDDFRRLLCDLPSVHNAWVLFKTCSCDIPFYALCKDNQLQLSFEQPDNATPIKIDGLYDILLEPEDGQVNQAVKDAKTLLQQRRNLAEDYCRIHVVGIEDVAVCADIEVLPDADIERVQAGIWFAIERYFNPPVRFYSLQELLDADTPVEDIFNGPQLTKGFIKADELKAAELRSVLRCSDIINSIMDKNSPTYVDGIISINNLLLSKYDADGHLIKGAADPEWDEVNQTFKSPPPGKTSAAWLLLMSALHQPRFAKDKSNFLILKNGLPFKPRLDEANDTLTQLHGAADRPKINNVNQDIPIPGGTFRNPEAYYPLQYGFPLAYGIGLEGLPAYVTPERMGQANQLKAYLMVFEQLLSNALVQLANMDKLFSLDPSIRRTYFVKVIQGLDAVMDSGFNQNELEAISETNPEFHERRNGFLDHLLARFGEQFSEYALLLTNYQGQQVALDRLIEDKIAFLKAYPLISRDRGRAFNYANNPAAPDNFSGLKKRVSLLLGYPDLSFKTPVITLVAGQYQVDFQLLDPQENPWLVGKLNVDPADPHVDPTDPETIKTKAFHDVMLRMGQFGAYVIDSESGQFRLKLKDYGRHPDLLKTQADAEALRDELIAWSANERTMIVEHLLLRPKFWGDALYPVCSDGGCKVCGDEDPYSFRLTLLMPGWTALYNADMDRRRFADRTIQQEIPAHLLAKLCWVGNVDFDAPLNDFVLNDLFELLTVETSPLAGKDPAEIWETIGDIVKAFSEAFKIFYADKIVSRIKPDALSTALTEKFKEVTSTTSIGANTLDAEWADIQDIMLAYFLQLALIGWQFERFEDAWQQWLQANAKIDWTQERLQEDLNLILNTNLVSGSATAICQCSTAILSEYGMKFYQWMAGNIGKGLELDEFPDFEPPDISVYEEGNVYKKPPFCAGFTFKTGTSSAIQDLLNERYASYTEVSYRLWQVLKLLSQLSNTYPEATLHDCDEGSDKNPVRLGSTALGSLGSTLSQS